MFCDSRADVCLVTEAKAKRDRMSINEEGARKLKIMDVTGDNVELAGTTIYWVGISPDSPKKPLKVYITKNGDYDEILLSTAVMKIWESSKKTFLR